MSMFGRRTSSKRERSLAKAKAKRQKLFDQCQKLGIPVTMKAGKNDINPETGRPYWVRQKPTTMGRMRDLIRARGEKPCC